MLNHLWVTFGSGYAFLIFSLNFEHNIFCYIGPSPCRKMEQDIENFRRWPKMYTIYLNSRIRGLSLSERIYSKSNITFYSEVSKYRKNYLSLQRNNLDKNEWEKSLLPVMVWIYGGAFTSGSSNIETFGPDYFIEENVIVVTFNYRVGVFGKKNIYFVIISTKICFQVF